MKIGAKGRILKILPGNKSYRHRLLALGLLPGTELIVKNIAPLGDPIEMGVRGVSLSLRKAEAAILQIEWLRKANEVC
jgi:ferrous iron transport protein A